MDLEVEQADDKSKDIMIGVFKQFNGDVMFDPQLTLTFNMDSGKIVEADINNCINTTLLGTTEVDSNDMLHGFGRVEKSLMGLRNMFSGFMDNMTEIVPYLTDPKTITKYIKPLSE